ncbi:hypothetical protein TIFTF001_028374 [Ficus carica]|uniref:Uncharacterized protein n=1 Tax=Ficus carica TaxID=3494 RepID=A0AA88J133_FICCA|nr:hypothetical protein TIFTF001_028374 [Ficus carica]
MTGQYQKGKIDNSLCDPQKRYLYLFLLFFSLILHLQSPATGKPLSSLSGDTYHTSFLKRLLSTKSRNQQFESRPAFGPCAVGSFIARSLAALQKAYLEKETVLPHHCRHEEVNLPVVHLLAGEEILELLAVVATFLFTRCEVWMVDLLLRAVVLEI